MNSFKDDKQFMAEAARFAQEDAFLKEDDGMKMVVKLSKALTSFEDFRADIKTIIQEKYPNKMKDFVKAYKGVDKEMVKLEKFIKSL